MPNLARAVLLNLGVFTADNGARRSVGAFACNYQAANANTNVSHITVEPGQLWTYSLTDKLTSLLVVRTTSPVKANISFEEVSPTDSLTRPAFSSEQIIKQVFVSDDLIEEITFENFQIAPIQLTIIQLFTKRPSDDL